MPPIIKTPKCTGCGACENICPGDLMVVEEGKALCRSRRDCWDCMSCVKVCPAQALEIRIPYQLGYYPAKLVPEMQGKEIIWTVTDLDGKEEKFTVKVRN
ncbi:4Fe-4S binding protein [Pelosinus sp. sgz500959]|uniref:4Fe-4S binding protein n=1 Tax=Pelosinus sp. sgz500959 TaxID=3242472 RepID=UPI003671E64F